MKKIDKNLGVLFLLMVMVTGCGYTESSDSYRDNQQVTAIETFVEKEEDNMIDYAEIAGIRLVDAIPDEYINALSVDVQSENVKDFKQVMGDLEFSDAITLKKPWYNVEIYDKNNNLIDVWTIDSYRTIQTTNGSKIKRTGNIDTVLSEIEEEYGITKQLFERQPGSNFFSNLDLVCKGVFQKKVETNFDDDYRFVLSSEMIDSICKNKDKIQIEIGSRKNYDVEYVVILYNNEGNVVHSFHIDAEGKVYTSSGYLLTGSFIEEWTANIVDVALNE